MDRLKKLTIKRFLARSIDYLWFTLAFEILISPFGWDESIALYIAWIAFIPFEALLIARCGTTPGKALLGLRIHSVGRIPIGFRRSLVRSIYVWIYGFWLGIPFLSLMAGMLAYNDCRENGSTIWDRKTELVVR